MQPNWEYKNRIYGAVSTQLKKWKHFHSTSVDSIHSQFLLLSHLFEFFFIDWSFNIKFAKIWGIVDFLLEMLCSNKCFLPQSIRNRIKWTVCYLCCIQWNEKKKKTLWIVLKGMWIKIRNLLLIPLNLLENVIVSGECYK